MEEKTQIVSVSPAAKSEIAELQKFESALVQFINEQGLPTSNVLVSIPERHRVFNNVEHVIKKLSTERRSRSAYISKFLAASASGLFDAALNYLWDETIYELRCRVENYDLTYFFDIAVKDPERRKKLKDAQDLPKVEDSELIKGANELGLVSDLGFKHLDFIRYMRNYASAAHPNQNEISGLQLISWLETCITEVFNLPQSTVVGEIKKILANIKANTLTSGDANTIAIFFSNLDRERVNALASGFFAIYIDPASGSQVRQNINALAPRLWPQVQESTRAQFGIRLAQYAASGEQERKDLARQFLDIVNGLGYIPDNLRVAEIETAIQDLIAAHRAYNNFYTEPPFARRLASLVQPPAKLPPLLTESYILSLVEVFLTNGNGVAVAANPIYQELLSQLDANQAVFALLSFRDNLIASRLQFQLCQRKFRELLGILKNILTAPAATELVAEIEKYPGPLSHLASDSRIKLKVRNVQTILGIA